MAGPFKDSQNALCTLCPGFLYYFSESSQWRNAFTTGTTEPWYQLIYLGSWPVIKFGADLARMRLKRYGQILAEIVTVRYPMKILMMVLLMIWKPFLFY